MAGRRRNARPALLQCIKCDDAVPSLERLDTCWGEPICTDCFLERLPLAAQFEINWPTVCCERHEDQGIESLKNHIDEDVLSQLRKNKAEYKTPVADRLYCSNPACAVFLGTIASFNNNPQCSKCRLKTCRLCRKRKKRGMHTCDTDEDEPLRIAHTKDLRVKNCPGCNTPVEHMSGCNQMVCDLCKTQFCWLCLAIPKHGAPSCSCRHEGDPEDDDDAEDDYDAAIARWNLRRETALANGIPLSEEF